MSRGARWVVQAAIVVLVAAVGRSLAAEPPALRSEHHRQFLPVIMKAPADWQMLDSGLESTLTAVFFVDQATGWVVGWGGAIARTDDGGQSWVPQQSGTESVLRDVFFDPDGHGWAVGDDILHSADGGRTWEAVRSPVETRWRAVQFLDRDHGWIAGGHVVLDYFLPGLPPLVWNYGYVLRTSDRGQSWVRSEEMRCMAEDVRFVDPLQGYAVSTCADVYYSSAGIERSTDGGASWEDVPMPEGVSLGTLDAITFADRAHGWAVGSLGVLSTSDGGLTWSLGDTGTSEQWRDVQFVSPSVGWVLSESVILRTGDGGQAWVAETFDQGPRGLGGLHFVDTEHGWAVGAGGRVYIRR
jgi:photosystem II stability/assembly factor-like uncharacterized protein